MKTKIKSIGPVSQVLPEDVKPQAEPDVPFTVDRNDPELQALAKLVGWDRLEKIERLESQETDLQRSPFSAKPLKIKKRETTENKRH